MPPTPIPDLWREAVDALDRLDRDVTDGEAKFLASVLPRVRAGRSLSSQQYALVVDMAERYLSVQHAAELRGQLRLLWTCALRGATECLCHPH
jgi:hypothetical protein